MTGIVVAIDEQGCRVRVQFPDRDDLVSAWLPVMQEFCVGNQQYRLPDEGNQVVCLMDDNCEDGIVLGAIYSDADPPPVTNKDLFYRRFKDGSIIQYDRDAHKLTAEVAGDVSLVATGSITSDSQGTTIIKSASELTLQAPAINILGYSGGAAEGTITGTLHITGNITGDAGINVSGSVIDGTGNTNHHDH